jgi:hypothetical protein
LVDGAPFNSKTVLVPFRVGSLFVCDFSFDKFFYINFALGLAGTL